MENDPTPNLPELSVTELSAGIKRTLETSFDYVRVRGELGRVTVPRSGHLYADLKDDKATISLVMFKNMMGSLGFQPEQGLEVIAEGRISAFAGQSRYQIIAKKLLPAGEGALMALLEKRKATLKAEGLFDTRHKKPLPYMPKTIGVVTSPTGAVIRDILHRLRDRMPAHVLVWPTLVQGDTAAPQVVRGIQGFNAMAADKRPDVIIVARGGGSFEDLWPFNDEHIARAAFASAIPIVSAIGHETDTTLLDLVADIRAPTPTGAAEVVVPVRADLLASLKQTGARKRALLLRQIEDAKTRKASVRLPGISRALMPQKARLDIARLKLSQAPKVSLQRARQALSEARLTPANITSLIQAKDRRVLSLAANLRININQPITKARVRAQMLFGRLAPKIISDDIAKQSTRLNSSALALRTSVKDTMRLKSHKLQSSAGLLNALSYKATLARGFAVVRDGAQNLVQSKGKVHMGQNLQIMVADGAFDVRVATGSDKPVAPSLPKTKTSESRQTKQGKLI